MMLIGNDSYFNTVADVNETWAEVKRISNWKETVGVALFTRMFELAPDAWTVFPWGKGMMSEDISQNEQFLKFAANFVGMLDMAIDMLGPDMELVEEQLFHLGVSHIDFGVTPKHYPLMGRALMDTFETTLGKERFTARQKASWQSIYQFMSTTMMEGAFDGLKKSAKIY